MVTQKSNIPALRFPEFKGEWEEKRLDQVSKLSRGRFSPRPRNDPKYFGGEIPFVQTGNVVNAKRYITEYSQTLNALGVKVSKVFPKNTILLTIAANIGDVAITKFDMACPDSLVGITSNHNVDVGFLFETLKIKKPILESYATQNAQANINLQILNPLEIYFPQEDEQKKIADFLTAVDQKIAQLTEKKSCLEQYKKGVMQRLFTQRLRFYDTNGNPFPDWEERALSDVLYEHQELSSGKEEVFSVSVHKGLINQIEHLGRSFSAKETLHYNLVKPFDLVYTKSPTGDFPYGIIKQSKVSDNVIVSPLYGVFTPETSSLGNILDWYFSSSQNTYNYLHSLVQKGAKNTMSITNKKFLSKRFLLPVSKDEQEKIGKFLNIFDDKITALGNQLAAAQDFKKSLLQKMFV